MVMAEAKEKSEKKKKEIPVVSRFLTQTRSFAPWANTCEGRKTESSRIVAETAQKEDDICRRDFFFFFAFGLVWSSTIYQDAVVLELLEIKGGVR